MSMTDEEIIAAAAKLEAFEEGFKLGKKQTIIKKVRDALITLLLGFATLVAVSWLLSVLSASLGIFVLRIGVIFFLVLGAFIMIKGLSLSIGKVISKRKST
jgi:hypothetical protein